ncbi:glycosyltransferase [Streptomyces sp. NPDC020742]|uniref:glycosyltransferase family 2 protein n=1 Tax=Streptomyces sp. NPDC020742 TaxID=3154897 RepID=UPI0033E8C31B
MPVPATPPGATPPDPDGAAPLVSVIVPVHNTRPYLARSLGSVFAQTLDQRRIEVIAVDDGSTDGSADWLTAQVRHHPNLTVIRQEASGGAGRPRNAGLDHATGAYVFFLDSDDRLGPEALDRLTRMAQAHGSDVVYGRIVGADGRPAPVDLHTTRARVTPFDSPVYWTLAAYKLFRRAFLTQHRLRFVEGRLLAEDLPFGIGALLHADTVSVLGDYDCYYLHGRPDDSNASRQDLDWCAYLHYIGTDVLPLVEGGVPPGPDRDRLLVRHFHGEILMPFAAPYLARSLAGRRAMAEAARPLVARHLTEGVLRALPPGLRLRAHCLRTADHDALTAVVRADTGADPGPPRIAPDGRVHAGYPFFRDPAHGIPDSCYDLTDRIVMRQRLTGYRWAGGVLHLRGTAALPPLDAGSAEVLLRGRTAEHRIPAQYDGERWRASVDPATAADGDPLPDGTWGLKIALTAHGADDTDGADGADGTDGTGPAAVHRAAWLVPEDAPAPGEPPDGPAYTPRITGRGPAGPTTAALFLSRPHGHLHLTLGRAATEHPLGTDLRGTATTTRTGRTTLTAHLTLPGCPPDAALHLLLHDPRTGRTAALRTAVEPAADDRYTVRARLRGGPPGSWQVTLRLSAGPLRLDLPVRTGDGPAPLTVTLPRPPRWLPSR